MRLTTKLLTIGAVALSAAALSSAPARADSLNFTLQFGPGSAFGYSNCYWQRYDRGRYDIVRQICRDRFGRTFVVPGSEQRIADRNRRNWRLWTNGEWRRYDNRNDWDRDRRDWDRGRDRWDGRGRGRDDHHDHDRGRDRRHR